MPSRRADHKGRAGASGKTRNPEATQGRAGSLQIPDGVLPDRRADRAPPCLQGAPQGNHEVQAMSQVTLARMRRKRIYRQAGWLEGICALIALAIVVLV